MSFTPVNSVFESGDKHKVVDIYANFCKKFEWLLRDTQEPGEELIHEKTKSKIFCQTSFNVGNVGREE